MHAELATAQATCLRHADQGNTARRLCAVGRLCCLGRPTTLICNVIRRLVGRLAVVIGARYLSLGLGWLSARSRPRGEVGNAEVELGPGEIRQAGLHGR